MFTAKSSLIFKKQDGKMLSCIRWFIAFMIYCFNLNIVLICLISMGFVGCFVIPNESNQINAKEKITMLAPVNINVPDIISQNEITNWLEAMNVKYAKYKLTYPKEGIIHAKGNVKTGQRQVRVNVLEINRKINPDIIIRPEIASKYLNSKAKIKTIAEKNHSIAAVNGGYFKPQTGVPLGALKIDNELLTGPVYNRVGLGINNDDTYSMGKTDIKFSLNSRKLNLNVDNINQPRMLSTYVLIYTDKWGKFAPNPPKYGVNILIKNNKAVSMHTSSVEIPKNGYVLSGPKKEIEKVLGQKNLKLKIDYPKHFEKSVHIISGGPYLVKDGEIYINTKEEKLGAITGKNPRTLIGYTKENSLIIATVDGREKYSVGMNLYEAAKFMRSLGCINAMNLDGGSSSVMYLNGTITNTPPSSGGIPIPGAITVNLNSLITKNKNGRAEM